MDRARRAAHISLAERGELLVIAPASADFMAKAAHGLADDLLSTLYLAFTGVQQARTLQFVDGGFDCSGLDISRRVVG